MLMPLVIDVLDEVYLNEKTYPDLNGATEYWWAGMRSLGDNAMSCPANYAAAQLHTQQPCISISSNIFPNMLMITRVWSFMGLNCLLYYISKISS